MNKFKIGDRLRFVFYTMRPEIQLKYGDEVSVVNYMPDDSHLMMVRFDNSSEELYWYSEDWFVLVPPQKFIYRWGAKLSSDATWVQFETDYDIRPDLLSGKRWIESLSGDLHNSDHYRALHLESKEEQP